MTNTNDGSHYKHKRVNEYMRLPAMQGMGKVNTSKLQLYPYR